MPGLPLTTKEMDLEGLKQLFENPDYRPDMLKVYPCMVMEGTKLYDDWKNGDFVPLATKEAAEIIAEAKRFVPKWCRIMRVQRDIPTFATASGVDRTNLRQYVNILCNEKNIICKCIRCREAGFNLKNGKKIDFNKIQTTTAEYEASNGKEFFIAAENRQKNGPAAHWLIRLQHDRLTEQTKENADGELIHKKLREIVSQSPILGQIEFMLRARDGKQERQVTQTVQVIREKILPPDTLKTDIQSINVTAILTKEINTPDGEEPIEWMLLTSVEIKDDNQAFEIIKWYLARWEIEIYFKILKSGCHIEELQLETEARMDACLAMYMIVAWRILYFTMLGRVCPDVSCDIVFQEHEWK